MLVSAWSFLWSRNFQTPLFLQELSKGRNGANEWVLLGWAVAPQDKADSALVRAALQWKRMGNPPLNSVKNGGGNQPLMGFAELSPGSLTVSAAAHFTSPAAFVHCLVYRGVATGGKGGEGGKEGRQSERGGGEGRN